MITSRLYYSREDRVAELVDENERVQWQDLDEDVKRIATVQALLDESNKTVFEAISQYADMVFEDFDDEEFQLATIAHARRELIEAWALAQASLSKVAHVIRFNGNDAFQRMMDALRTGEAVDMRGL